MQSALLLNLLTEDNLPHYYQTIVSHFGTAGVWGEWNRRWTAEEGRHAIVIRDYLTCTRSIDLRQLERARMAQVSSGLVPNPPTIAEGIVYVALQELATRISHRNTGKLLDDAVGDAIMTRVAADENLHHLFYRDLATAALEVDPSSIVIAIDQQVRTSRCRAPASPTSRRTPALIAEVGVYDFASHHDNILVPVVVKHWRLDQLTGLTPEAEEARDRVLQHIEKVGRVARRTADRRDRNANAAV